MKEAVSRKNGAHKAMCWNSNEENKRRYEGMKNKVKKAVSKATREKVEKAVSELKNCPIGIFSLVK